MNNEKAELRIILSDTYSKSRIARQCEFCNITIEPNTEVQTLGIIDRLTKRKSRIYLCPDHTDYIQNYNRSDIPEYQKEYLFNTRYIEET